MSLTVPAADLARAVTTAAQVIQRRNTAPILGGMHLRQEPDALVVTGTDLDRQLSVRVDLDRPQANGAAFEAALPEPRKLAQAIKISAAEDVVLGETTVGETPAVSLRCGDMDLSVRAWPADDFPSELVREDEAIFEATLGSDAIAAIRRVSGAISREDTRYNLNGIYLHKQAGGSPWAYTAVATDGIRMMLAPLPLPDATGDLRDHDETSKGIIIPRPAVETLLALPIGNRPLRFSLRTKMARNSDSNKLQPVSVVRAVFDDGRHRLIAKLIDGTFPDYGRVIPKKTPAMATFERAELLRTVEFISTVSSDMHRAVKLAFDGAAKTVTVSAEYVDIGAEGRRTLPYSGAANFGAATVGFNGGYFADVLRRYSDSEHITLAFEGASVGREPTVIVSPTDDRFKAILMPMRV